MYRYLLLATAFLAGCSKHTAPQLGTPEALDVPTTGALVGPRFAAGPENELVMSWMRREEAGATLQYATLDKNGFATATDVINDPKMFVNWADVPSVMPVAGNHWIAHWLSYSANHTYSYDVVVAQSSDGGSTWSEAVRAHTDGTPTEHGFVSMHRDADGVALLWLDGRNTEGEATDDPLATAMTLRAAVLTADGQRLREQVVDDSVCDCCQTDVAVASSGPIAVYRNRTAEEIRDIHISRYQDGRWSPGEVLFPDNWMIPGCPVNGPSISAAGDLVAVAWFAVWQNQPTVRVMISTDAGATFNPPVEIAASGLSGFVGTALLDTDTIAVSWVGKGHEGFNAVNVRTVTTSGELGPVITAGDTRQVRVFPQLACAGEHLVMAWTDDADEATVIEAVRIPINSSL